MSPRWTPAETDPESYLGPGVDLPVFFGDLDPNNHINNVAFGRYFELHRVMSHRESGLSVLVREHAGNMLVGRVTINYIREGLFGRPLHLRLRVSAVGTSSVTEVQGAWQDGALVAFAEVVIVWTQGGRPAPLPPALRAAFEELQVTPA